MNHGTRTRNSQKARPQAGAGQGRAGSAHQTGSVPDKGETSMNEKRSGTGDLVDMELHCVRCQARLYVPVPQARAVMVSLEQAGAAILICVCGQAQLIWPPQQKQRND